MSFGENLKRRREQKDLTQQQLANNVSVSQVMIAQYESGIKFPNVLLAVKIARRLGTTCEELVGDSITA